MHEWQRLSRVEAPFAGVWNCAAGGSHSTGIEKPDPARVNLRPRLIVALMHGLICGLPIISTLAAFLYIHLYEGQRRNNNLRSAYYFYVVLRTGVYIEMRPQK